MLPMFERFKKYITLRNQILVFFLFAMAIVLILVGLVIFNLVGRTLKENADKQIQQTAIQASGRIDNLYEQMNLLTIQVATNAKVQKMLEEGAKGKLASFQDRQSLVQTVSSYRSYSNGIHALELYLPDLQMLYPIGESYLSQKVENKWIKEADKAKGAMVWIGENVKHPEQLLAIRRISLMDRWYSNGGYLLIYVDKDYFNYHSKADGKLPEDEYTIIFDNNMRTVSSTILNNMKEISPIDRSTVSINNVDYMMVKQTSNVTSWTLVILTPVKKLTQGLAVLKIVILVSGIIGFIIFFIFSLPLSTMITKPIFRLVKTMRNADQGELIPSTKSSPIIEIDELNRTYNKLVEDTNHLIQVVYEKELLRSHTELRALQAQINPHFLFNTLNALYWSLDEKGEDRMASQVIAMSNLFRYTITQSNKDEWVTMKEEIEHIERYMLIMQMRLGEELSWEITMLDEYKNISIPKLMIQPLIENAVVHGIGNKVGGGKISITIKQSKQDYLLISVQDNGPGMDEITLEKLNKSMKSGHVQSLKGTGIGIANVNRRIQLYYKDMNNKGLRIESSVGAGTTVSLEIPINGGGLR